MSTPHPNALRRAEDRERVEQIILLERVHLYNAGTACGATVLRRRLIEQEYLRPVPSVSQIGAVLRAYGLTHGRLGWNDNVEPRWPFDFTKRPKGGATS
jgi:hypothetical protein